MVDRIDGLQNCALAESKVECIVAFFSERQRDEFERKVKRLEERIARIDDDRNAAEIARRNLEAQLRLAQT